MVSRDPFSVAAFRSSPLDPRCHDNLCNHGNSSSSNDGRGHILLDSTPNSIPQRKAREIVSRYISPNPPCRTSAAYASSFSSVTHRFSSLTVDRTPYAPNTLSSSKRSNYVERRRHSPSRASEQRPLSASNLELKRNPTTPLSDKVPWPSTRGQTEAYTIRPAKTRPDSKPRASTHISSHHTKHPFANVAPRNLSAAHHLQKETPERMGSPLSYRQSFDHAENSSPSDASIYIKNHQHRWPSSRRLQGAALSKTLDLTARREGSITSKAASLLLNVKSFTSNCRGLHSTTNFGSFSRSMLSSYSRSPSPALRTSARRLNLETRWKEKQTYTRARQVEPVRESDGDDDQLAFSDPILDVSAPKYRSTSVSNSINHTVAWSGGLPQHSYKPALLPLSPSKVYPSLPGRSLPSPMKCRPASSTISPLHTNNIARARSNGASTTISFGADPKKGRRSHTQAEAAFLNRILDNRLLQWHFVNARERFATEIKRLTGEKMLFSVWARTTELRKSVTTKRIKLQQVHQAHKLNSILKAQGSNLQDWGSYQYDHSIALCGIVEALGGAVLRLPVDEGVKADTQGVKDAVASAVDVVQTLESSATSLLEMMEMTNKLISDLALVMAQERSLMEDCGNLLLLTSIFQAEECSLRMHLMQFEQEKAKVLGALDWNQINHFI